MHQKSGQRTKVGMSVPTAECNGACEHSRGCHLKTLCWLLSPKASFILTICFSPFFSEFSLLFLVFPLPYTSQVRRLNELKILYFLTLTPPPSRKAFPCLTFTSTWTQKKIILTAQWTQTQQLLKELNVWGPQGWAALGNRNTCSTRFLGKSSSKMLLY